VNKFKLFFGVCCIVLAIVIFVYGSGLRVVYSGGFFTLIGLYAIYTAVKNIKSIR
jgi:uncharacterized membrane protein